MSEISLETFAGEVVLEELAKLREQFPKTGLYPVLIGDEFDCDQIQECIEMGADEGLTPQSILEAASHVKVGKWLTELRSERLTDGQPGEWPTENVSQLELVTYLDLETNEPKEEVGIALLPIKQPYQAFAALMWGGWNSCPDAADHCAVHRYWAEKYGAEVMSVTGDIVQCWVANPPTTPEAALELAWEHYSYCPDIVLQGTDTVAELAAALMNSEFWYFWWE